MKVQGLSDLQNYLHEYMNNMAGYVIPSKDRILFIFTGSFQKKRKIFHFPSRFNYYCTSRTYLDCFRLIVRKRDRIFEKNLPTYYGLLRTIFCSIHNFFRVKVLSIGRLNITMVYRLAHKSGN